MEWNLKRALSFLHSEGEINVEKASPFDASSSLDLTYARQPNQHDAALLKDYAGFVRAAKKRHAIGWSIYDYNTTVSSAWPQLRKG